MGVRPLFDRRDIERQINEKRERVNQAILLRLRRVGLEFVRNARNNADFTDRTGNLRSSIGFVIMKDGNVVHEDFERNQNKVDNTRRRRGYGREGLQKGIELAKSEVGGISKGFAIVVVAGMEYAAAVESRGFDVLTGSSIVAANDLRRSLGELKQKLSK